METWRHGVRQTRRCSHAFVKGSWSCGVAVRRQHRHDVFVDACDGTTIGFGGGAWYGFTYQGQLQNNGTPATGSYDFQFILYDAAVGGSQVSGTPIVTRNAAGVNNGQFTVSLDFGGIWGNSGLFLEIAVRPAGNGGTYTTLSPRQEITPAPYAQYAIRATNATNTINATNAIKYH